MVAVDTVGAGEGEFVLITQGSSARLTPETKILPVDTVIIGIIDSVHVDHACVYDKEGTGLRRAMTTMKPASRAGDFAMRIESCRLTKP